MAQIIMVGKWDTWTRRSQQGSLLLQKGVGAQKACAKKKRPSLFIPKAGDYLSPSHWSSQGAHSSPLANLKQIVTGRRGGVLQEGVLAETRAKWSNQDFLWQKRHYATLHNGKFHFNRNPYFWSYEDREWLMNLSISIYTPTGMITATS